MHMFFWVFFLQLCLYCLFPLDIEIIQAMWGDRWGYNIETELWMLNPDAETSVHFTATWLSWYVRFKKQC